MKKNDSKNQIYDINKFPHQPGILLFGLSISRLSNAQSPKEILNTIKHFDPKITYPQVGLNMIYSDSLYYNNNNSNSHELKRGIDEKVASHRNEFLKVIKGSYYVPTSFSFISWSQMILDAENFVANFNKIKEVYKRDKLFQKYVKADTEKKNPNTAEVDFILEEITLFYLASKGLVRLRNDFVQDKEKWILWCYPGKPLFSEIYLYKSNPLKLANPNNKYENSFYDLDSNKLYDFDKIDLADFYEKNI